MSERDELLALKRDSGNATAAELAELDASLAAADAQLRNGTALVGENGGLAVPGSSLIPSTWDYTNGGNARAIEAWLAQNADAEAPRIVLAPAPPPDFDPRRQDPPGERIVRV